MFLKWDFATRSVRFKQVLNIILLLIIGVNCLSAQIFYVKAGFSGAGTSWGDASGDLNQVLSNALPGSQVWIASGTYFPVQCNPCIDADRDIAFEIPDSVAVYGGFNGTEINLEQRDWSVNTTILSGDIDMDNQLLNNSKTIVHFTRVSNLTILDGFLIKDGYAHTPGGSMTERENSGAAIFNQGGLSNSNSHPNIRNCMFENNVALGFGGAVFNNGGFGGNANPIFENCSFENNASELGGGALFNQASFSGTTTPIFMDCRFFNNTANQQSGGGVYNQGAENGNASPIFANCTFEGNASSDYGGGIHSHGRKGKSNSTFDLCIFIDNEANFGGGVSNNGTVDGESNATFTNCRFEANHVTGDGGAVFNWGTDGVSDATFLDCIFEDNNSDFAGAGIFNNGIDGVCNARITNCQFIDNTAITYGGAVYNNGKRGNANAKITNCLFQDNRGNSAGAVYNLGSENGNANAQITNCTFYGNLANVGAAVYNNASDSTGSSNAIITNCIFWKNEANFGNVFRNIFSTPFIQYSVVDEPDCDAMNSGLGSDVSCGDGLLFNVYPEFEDTLNNNFRLKSSSPLLDLGDNATIDTIAIDFDLDHQIRIFNDVVDLGAYEYSFPFFPPSITDQTQSTRLCEGEFLSLFVDAMGTPPLSYKWFKNGNEVVDATSAILNVGIANSNDAGIYTCEVIGTNGNAVNSDSIIIEIDSIVIPMISIDEPGIDLCEGEAVTIIANSLNGGTNPVYQWYLNNAPIGGNSNTIDFNNLQDGDWVEVELSSSLNCAIPSNVFDSIQMAINPLLEASIEINGPDSIVCLGSEILFTSTYLNEGNNPLFQWYVNGVEDLQQYEDVFVSSNLEDSDIISCRLISSEQCVFEDLIFSNEIMIEVDSCLTNTLVLLDNNNILISPNPSNGLIHIMTDGLNGNYNLSIINLAGNRVFEQEIPFADGKSEDINLSFLSSGIYFMKTSNNKDVNLQKIVISK